MGLLKKIEKVLLGLAPAGVPQRTLRVEAKTANYQVLVGDTGTVFTTRGAGAPVTFTLPALADSVNCHYWFNAIADENMIIASTEGNNMITSADAAASSVAYQTVAELLSGSFYLVNDGTAWLVFSHIADANQTVTVV